MRWRARGFGKELATGGDAFIDDDSVLGNEGAKHGGDRSAVTGGTRVLSDRIIVLHNGRLVADGDPADIVDRAASLTLGFLVVLDTLSPEDRAVFLLADVFAVPFPEVAEIVGRLDDPDATKADRARAMVRLSTIVGARARRTGAKAVASGRMLADLLLDAMWLAS